MSSFFLENVSTHYLRHVLFVWRLLMWKKKRFKLCFLCLQNGESKQRFVHLADFQQYFSFEGHTGDLKSRINSWWLLVLPFFPHSLGACTRCRLHATQWRCPPASVRRPASKMKPHFTGRLPWLLLTLGYEQHAEHINVKKKKSVFTFTVPYVSTCMCTCASYIFASIYIDQRKARFHKNKARVGIQFFVFKLCRKNMT